MLELAADAPPAAPFKIGVDEKGDVDGVMKGEKGEDDEGAAEKGADGVVELSGKPEGVIDAPGVTPDGAVAPLDGF